MVLQAKRINKKNMLISLLLLFSVPLVNCKAPLPRLGMSRQPVVRVGIVEQRTRVDFAVGKPVAFRRANGGYALRNAQKGRWKVEAFNTVSAEVEYRLVVSTSKNRFSAEESRDSVMDKGVDVVVKKRELNTPLSISYAHDAVYQVLLSKKFKSEAEARAHQSKIADKTVTELAALPMVQARGLLRFTNINTGQSFESRQPIRIQMMEVEIADVDVGSGFHWESSETRRYDGIIEFVLDHAGKVTVVNHLQLEHYIKGVVPSEMPASFPVEALKAQAVTARVEALAKVGLRHPQDLFDLCDDVHCQVFSGLSKRAEVTDRVVESTRGIFMIYRNKFAEAFYAGLCGGHTENNDNVWMMSPEPYLRGGLDMSGKSLRTSLTRENNVKKWIDSKPDVYCNANRKDIPKSVNYGKRYFRWQVEYSREELEKIIREKTGEEFGDLLNLKPIKRGVSGRLIELEIIGSRRHFRIGKELAIRQALSNRTLYSACFYVEKIGSQRGRPAKFLLKGAGWGHGVGMCQVGAAVMGHRGKKYDQILTHYYKGVFLEKLYR